MFLSSTPWTRKLTPRYTTQLARAARARRARFIGVLLRNEDCPFFRRGFLAEKRTVPFIRGANYSRACEWTRPENDGNRYFAISGALSITSSPVYCCRIERSPVYRNPIWKSIRNGRVP